MGAIIKLNDVLCSSINRVDSISKTSIELWDDNTFCPASPTPTPTPSRTPAAASPTPTPTRTPTPTPTPAGLTKYTVTLCCNPDIVEVIESTGLSSGDVILDSNGYCWLVIDTTSDAVTITFDSYFGTDCKECTDQQGCIWEIRCCPGYTVVDYVNDSPAYIGALYPGVFVKCSNDLCYEVIQAVNQIPTENIVSVYGKCVDCSDDGGNQCR